MGCLLDSSVKLGCDRISSTVKFNSPYLSSLPPQVSRAIALSFSTPLETKTLVLKSSKTAGLGPDAGAQAVGGLAQELFGSDKEGGHEVDRSGGAVVHLAAGRVDVGLGPRYRGVLT